MTGRPVFYVSAGHRRPDGQKRSALGPGVRRAPDRTAGAATPTTAASEHLGQE